MSIEQYRNRVIAGINKVLEGDPEKLLTEMDLFGLCCWGCDIAPLQAADLWVLFSQLRSEVVM